MKTTDIRGVRRRWSCSLMLAASLAGPGCATLVKGRTQTIAVTSEPPGAQVFVGGDLVGITPARFILSRKKEVVLRIEKEGYAPQSVALKKHASAWLGGDLAYGYFVGAFGGTRQAVSSAATLLGVDLLTGAANNLKPSIAHLRLAPSSSETGSSAAVSGPAATALTDEEQADARRVAREWASSKSRREK